MGTSADATGPAARAPCSMTSSLPVLAGATSTVLFAASALPMLVKAYRTRDLSSYSLGNILLANFGNVVHAVYVFSLPPGPIWVLHSFYLVSTATMLTWFLRYGGMGRTTHAGATQLQRSPDAAADLVSVAS
jgi:hypothetical protein